MITSGQSIAVLISGGVDSGVLLAELPARYRRVIPLYIRSGLFWEAVELYWLGRYLNAVRRRTRSERDGRSGRPPGHVEAIRILNLRMQDLYDGHWSLTGRNVPDYGSADPSMYLPGRNLLLLTKASLFCALHQIPSLALGPLKGNPFPDASRRFFRAFEKAARIGLGMRLAIQTPYLRLTKEQVIQRGKNLPLELTFSCIRPAGRSHCGRCNKCAERQRAFVKAGIPDKTQYRNLPGRKGAGRPRHEQA